MIEYKDNETYERDKAALIRIAEGNSMITIINNADVIAELLRQSKWIGNDGDNSVLPISVKMDGNGLAIKDYEIKDWFQKLNEELDEIKIAVINRDDKLGSAAKIAEELQDLITVCTSMLEWLGFSETARENLTKQINEKNRKRGYFEEV